MIKPIAVPASIQSTALAHATAVVVRISVLPRHASVMLLLLLLLRRCIRGCCGL